MTNEELTTKFIHLDERVTRNDERIKTLFTMCEERKELVDVVNSLATSIQLMAHEQKSLAERVGTLAGDIAEIKGRPNKRWDAVISTLITVVVTACVTFVLAKIGVK